jgi:hypothetical protein
MNDLLRTNLERVFNEREDSKRAAAISELYVANPIMFEPDAVVEGRDAISKVAAALLTQFGPSFEFTPEGQEVGHHGLSVLRWQGGPRGGPIQATGADAAEVVDGRISKLWVLLNH